MNAVEPALTPREVISRIRREQFLLDVDVSEEVALGLRNMRQDLDQALRLLSEELYSKPTHFVLELVQNADDNRYGAGVVPMLSIQLSPDRMVVSNNEVGFTEANVLALCRTGQSSKLKKDGYIGEKGIGFKSVFNVSDAPEIHSNGYHFKFDRTGVENLLGFVVPHWYETAQLADNATTTIVLPAKPGVVFNESTLEDIDSKLLLFLSKVRELELQTTDGSWLYTRRDDGSVTRLTSTHRPGQGDTQVENASYVRFAQEISMGDINEEKRKGIETTKLTLAFPVSESGKAAPEPGCPTFAFLPIRPFGFSFCVQGDFLLISSREDIRTDRLWNLRLRDNIANAFVAAIEVFKNTADVAFSYLKFLPGDSDVKDAFFKPVVKQLISQLGQTPCIPSASGAWRKPSEILLAGKAFQKLFPSSDAQELFGLDYADGRLVADDATLKRIGCRPLTYVHILSVFKEHGEWLSHKKKDWLAMFYAHLAADDLDALVKHKLLSLPCIPTSDGTFAIPEKGSVFYPLSNKKRYGFEHELTIIDYELFEKASSLSDKVGAFFEILQVKKDNPFELVKSHILQKHAGEVLTSDHNALVGHLRYIKDKLNEYLSGAALQGQTEDQALTLLKNDLWLGTKRNEEGTWYFDRASNLYLAKEYQPEFCIETLLGDALAPGKLVSSEYLRAKSKKADEQKVGAEAAAWREFMKRLGVSEAPKVESSYGGDVKCSAEMEALLGSPQYLVRRAVLECIDRNSAQYSSHYTFAAKVGRSTESRFTQFTTALQSMLVPTRKHVSVCLSDAYLRTPEIAELFGESPVYVDATLSTELLRTACGVTYRVDANACIKRLIQLRTEGGATTPQIKRIYRQLERLWDKEGAKIKDAFAKKALIRVKGEGVVWLSPEQVTWRSTSPFLDSLYPPLHGQYLDFSTFFVKKLEVSRELSTAKMVAALLELANTEPANERAGEALRIYRHANGDLASRLKQAQSDEPDWLDTFRSREVFITRNGKFVANDETLYVDDLPEMGALFADADDISMLAMPPDEIPRVWRLLDAVEVQYLSDSLVVEVVEVQEGVRNTALTSRVRAMHGFMARVLYHKSPEKFEEACAEGLFARLWNLEVVEVPELQLRVTLHDVTKIAQGNIALEGQRIYVRRGVRSLVDRLAMEICKLLQAPDALVDTIGRLLLAENADAAEDFLGVKNIGQLPAEEKAAVAGGIFGTEGENADEEEQPTEPAESVDQAAQAGVDESQDRTDSPHPAEGVEAAPSIGPNEPNLASPSRDGASQNPHGRAETTAPPTPAASPISTLKTATTPNSGSATLGKSRPADQIDEPRAPTAPPEATPSSSAPPSSTFEPGSVGRNFVRHPPGTQRKGGTGRRKSERAQARTKSGRLLSYADAPQDGDRQSRDTDDQRSAEARAEIEQAAVQYFLSTQAHRWRLLEEMPHDNPGFDVKAVAHDGADEEIEVKGRSGAWTEEGVAVSSKELIHANQLRSRYWLCVVEFATDENRRQLYLVNDPFGRTTQFRFDSGWKSQAISESAQLLRPESGLSIEIPGEGSGVIVSAKNQGRFCKLHIQLKDGRQIFKPFNPATMKLSRE